MTAPARRQERAPVVDIELWRQEHDVPRGRSIVALVIAVTPFVVFLVAVSVIVDCALKWAQVGVR